MSLYLQLTEKCNMSCDHCAMSATTKGRMMTQEVFDKAMELATEYSFDITLGGGEPTLHPKVIDWAMEAAMATIDQTLGNGGPATFIVTNGKKTETAIKLAKMAHLGIIGADLSQDIWHDEIDERVVQEFTRYNKPDRRHNSFKDEKRGFAGIRNVEDGVKARGRAIENGLSDMDSCACNSLFIKPNGDFYQCGCAVTKLGNILTDSIPQEYFEQPGECEHDSPLAEVEMAA